MISRHTSTSTGATLAPPIREQWYLLASPFLSKVVGTKHLHLLEELEALFGREMADNFAQRPPWGLRSRVKQLKVPPGGLVP
jgi:hypothetical protein